MNPVKIYRSGLVRRWHQNPEMSQFDQNDAAHQWGCAMLLLILHPSPSNDLLIYVLTHDVGEIDAGDLANPSKNRQPQLSEMLREFESRSRAETLGVRLETRQHLKDYADDWLWLVDKLEAVLFMLTFHPQLAQSRGWPGHIEEVIEKAVELKCSQTVRELIEGVQL